jgi:uncharacterized C2H2 Zn-finger protein
MSLTCQECDLVFTSRKELSTHNIEHTKAEILQCTECGKTFRTETTLKTHMKRGHENKGFKKAERSKRSLYTDQQKIEAVKMAKEIGLKEASTQLSISPWIIKVWTKLVLAPVLCTQCGSAHLTRKMMEDHKKNHLNNSLQNATKEKRNKNKLKTDLSKFRKYIELKIFPCPL